MLFSGQEITDERWNLHSYIVEDIHLEHKSVSRTKDTHLEHKSPAGEMTQSILSAHLEHVLSLSLEQQQQRFRTYVVSNYLQERPSKFHPCVGS